MPAAWPDPLASLLDRNLIVRDPSAGALDGALVRMWLTRCNETDQIPIVRQWIYTRLLALDAAGWAPPELADELATVLQSRRAVLVNA